MQLTRTMLRLNMLTCVGFGLAFLMLAPAIGRFLGEMPPLFLRILGAGLVLHGMHLFIISVQTSVTRLYIYYFSAGDLLWFLASTYILIAMDLITTRPGVIATFAVGLMVASIGLAQVWAFAEATDSGIEPEGVQSQSDWYLPRHHSRWKAIGMSWLGIKTWVKVWLFTLNGVFLSSLYFWPSQIASVILGAFIASGPLLIAVMIDQRGVTRFLGAAHIIPWAPLLVYLLLRLCGERVGVQITFDSDPVLYLYVTVLTSVVTVCLLFDIYDLCKWFSGAKGRLGSISEAHSHVSNIALESQK